MKYFCVAAILFVAAVSPLATDSARADDAAEPMPIDSFFERRVDYQHILSPNGKHLAYITDYPNFYALSITDLDKSEVIYQTNISRHYPRNLEWLSDRRLMFNVSGKIYAINIDGTDLRVLIDNVLDRDSVKSISSLKKNYRTWEVISTLPEDDEIILVRSEDLKGYQSVHKLNVYTGEQEDLYDGKKHKVNRWIVDGDGQVKLAVRFKKDRSYFFEFDEQTKKLNAVFGQDEDFNFNYNGRTYLENRARPIQFSYVQNEIYVTENLSQDTFSVVSYNYTTGDSRTVLKDEKYDVGDTHSPARLIFDRQAKKLAGVRYHRDKLTTVWLDDKLKTLQAEIDSNYPDKVNSVLQWTADHKRVLFRSFDEKTPGKVIIYLPETRKMVVQTIDPPALDEAGFAAMADASMVSYKTRDGQAIEAYLTSSPQGVDKPKPLIVQAHGGPFARTIHGYDPYAQFFASRGYAVLEPNFRGSTGYGREHLLQGKGAINSTMIDDIADGVNWAIQSGVADPERIYIMGSSYGGYAAIMSGIKYPSIYKAAASYGAPLDIKQQIKWYKKKDYYFAYEFWNEMVLGGNRSRAHLKEISPMYQVAKVTIPTHIYHGDEDDVVPYSHAEKLSKMLKKNNNKLVTVKTLKDEGHDVMLTSNKIYFANQMLKLFSE